MVAPIQKIMLHRFALLAMRHTVEIPKKESFFVKYGMLGTRSAQQDLLATVID